MRTITLVATLLDSGVHPAGESDPGRPVGLGGHIGRRWLDQARAILDILDGLREQHERHGNQAGGERIQDVTGYPGGNRVAQLVATDRRGLTLAGRAGPGSVESDRVHRNSGNRRSSVRAPSPFRGEFETEWVDYPEISPAFQNLEAEKARGPG